MRSNLTLARSRAGGARIWAVVKADAYGHGLANAVNAFAGADGMALIEFDGALTLRELGWRRPVLMLEGAFDVGDVELAAQHRLSLVVHCEEQVRMIETQRLPRRLDLQLKINTGMNRLGFRPEMFRLMFDRLRANPNVGEISFITHLANADVEERLTPLPWRVQAESFNTAIAGVPGEFSIANSAADLLATPVPGHWVRPGVMLYGGSPGAGTGIDYGLRPAMTLAARIIGVQQLAIGESVGYGSRFVARRPTRIGIVACGYADGYPRSAADGTPVLVAGVRVPIAGRVSMDMITVDLSEVPAAGVGSEAILWGAGLSIDEVAQACGTIGYELMCALAPRVRRQVHDTPSPIAAA
jgi:alanine racemase